MRLFSVFRKSIREQRRDLLSLSLALIFAPCMVLLYWLFFPSGSTTYTVLVLNNDAPVQLADGSNLAAGRDVIDAIKHVTYADGKPLLVVRQAANRAEADRRLRDREAHVLLVIPAAFSQALAATIEGQAPAPMSAAKARVTFVGDLTNPYYSPSAVMVSAALDGYLQAILGQQRPVTVVEEALGSSSSRTEFENYVPGLLVFALIMLVFSAAMTVTAEVEAGTLRRLQLTRMTALDLLGGTGAALTLVGMVALLLAFATALVLGFRSYGPLWVAILIGVVTMLSVIGTGLLVACFSKTVNQAFLLANFPLAIFMFFSGAVFPLPRVTLFTVAGHAIGLYDLLPPTHAVVALNKVLTLGMGLGGVLYEIVALTLLSVLYFAVGVWLFQRRHMQAE